MVPADGNFTTAIAKGDHKTGEVQGQTRQHARLINLLGVKQFIVGVNKMDCDVAKYGEARYVEIRDEMVNMLSKVGYNAATIEKIPIIPISGWIGDNLIAKSANMGWWNGMEVPLDDKKKVKVMVVTLLDALEKMVKIPTRITDKDMRMPVSGVYKIKGVGDVITGRVEQGKVSPGDEVEFLPTSTASKTCTGKIFTVEMHHKQVPFAGPGDNVGLNVKGLEKTHMPRSGDVMVMKKDKSLQICKSFTAQVQVLTHPGELKVGYTPIAFVRTGRSAVKIAGITWKMGKATGNAKVENPPSLKSNDVAEVVFEPQQPFVCESFKTCEGLGRVAIMEGNSVIMLGKVVKVEHVA
jgi:elongation factor 1-alpha